MSIFGTDKMNIRKKSDVKKDETVVPSNEDVNVDEVMRKYDRESNTRIWQGIPKAVITSVMVLFSVYCLLMTLFSVEQAETRLARFLAFVIIIGYLMYPVKKTGHTPNHIPWYDIVLMVVGAGSFVYFSVNAVDIMMMGTRIGTLEVVLGICGIAVLIELCRRCVGIPIIVVVGCLLIYAFYWQFSHGADAYRALTNIVQKLFYTTSGVIGTPTNVCYTYIVLFIIFGAFLERTGIANFFISFANRLAGWSSGGPAKVAVISSALCGMVSGSSVGNTVTTGSVTIPMMKKTGYRPEFAGAVEAASSTGGQIMPPIMGAAAFLMAEYMGIPYIQVATIAIIPALLYFGGIFCTVHLEAKARGLKGIPFNELPTWIYLLKNCYLIIPLVVLVWIVSAGIYTMAVSAAISIFVAFVIGCRRPQLHCGCRSMRAGWHDRWLHHRYRPGLHAHQRYRSCCWRLPYYRPGSYYALLHRSGHGRSHHGKLLHHGSHLRSHPDSAWRTAGMRSLLRVLLRHPGRHYASCCPGSLRRQCYRKVEADEDRRHRIALGHSGVHRSVRICLLPGPYHASPR